MELGEQTGEGEGEMANDATSSMLRTGRGASPGRDLGMRQVRSHSPRVVLLASGNTIGETARAVIDGFTCAKVSLFPDGAQRGVPEYLGKADAVVLAGPFDRNFVRSLTARCRASALPVFNCGSHTGPAVLAILTRCIQAVGH